MPANKNALIRYKTIDSCLRKRYRHWTIEDLVDACCETLYELEGTGVSLRTVQGDLQIMRSDKLGYNAPIEVYDNKYYRYSDPEYSILNLPMTQNDFRIMKEAVDMLRQLQDFDQFAEVADVVGRLQDCIDTGLKHQKPIIHFDSVPDLKGLRFLNPLYNYIANQQTISIYYQSFKSKQPRRLILYPYMLKEFRNRWFLFGSLPKDMSLQSLALDRIVSVELEDKIKWKENHNFDASHYFDDIIGVSKPIRAKPCIITFWASPQTSNYIETKPLHKSQKQLAVNADGSRLFQIEVIVNREMFSVFMSYGSGVCILSPAKAANYLKTIYTECLNAYNNAL